MKNRTRPFLLGALALLFSLQNRGQYYFRDLASHQENFEKYSRLKKARVISSTVTSYEPNGAPSEGFSLRQQCNAGYTQVKTIMEVPFSGRMAMTNYYTAEGLLYRTTDSGYQTFTRYEYAYDTARRLVSIVQRAQAAGEKTVTEETHRWEYDQRGFPLRMVKKRDGGDSTVIALVTDDAGRVLEEYAVSNGTPGEKTYYYYDDAGRLTDIVRYNARAGKLVADMMFDYDDQGRVKQRSSLEQGALAYSTWIIIYNEQGLVSEEKFYDTQKKLAGRMAYQYVFRK
jgi:YD repeat-containing protein